MSTAERPPELQHEVDNAVAAVSQRSAFELTAERSHELRQLFNGVALVIDDEVNQPDSQIATIVRQIQDGGGKVVTMTDLPEAGYDFSNFAGVSFFVLDWQLHQTIVADGEELAPLRHSEAFLRQELRRKIAFLKKIMEHRLAPVFIFTSSDLENVKEALRSEDHLYADSQPSHIMVGAKEEVIKKRVFDVLVEWIHERPSAYVLKTWEREYEKAKNAMFNDLYTKSVDWPVLLWKTFKDDSLPASDEMGRLITRIIFSRMTPFHINLDQFLTNERHRDDAKKLEYRKKLLAVLEAERFVRADGLHKDSIAPGDVFKLPRGKYAINIRPDCDCIDRGAQGELELYLLEGSALTPAQVEKMLDEDRGLLQEGEAQVAVFSMYEEKTIVFSMKNLEKTKWSELKDKRIGRLLPPYLTRLQQRYASYLQRPGLSRIPREAIAPKPDSGSASESQAGAAVRSVPTVLPPASAPAPGIA